MRGVGVVNVTVEPRAEPMALVSAKNHLYYTLDDQDTAIAGLVTTARLHVEAYLQRALVLQTVELAFEQFHDVFRLDRSPIMKFGSVQYRDSAGAYQTLDPAVYQVDTRSEPGRLVRAYGAVWPQIRGGEDLHSVLITYQAGYLAPATASAGADTLTVQDNPFANGEKVYVSQDGGAVPAGLTENAPYYVVGTSGNAFQLSVTSGGAAVDMTSAGSGSIFVSRRRMPESFRQAMKLMLGHWFENRENVVVGTITAKLPEAASRLLAPYRLQTFA
jgi:uncharacterized phiE125 gp8 family phage protein